MLRNAPGVSRGFRDILGRQEEGRPVVPIRFVPRQSLRRGLPPGDLTTSDAAPREPAAISVIDYGKDTFEKHDQLTADQCVSLRDSATVTWINVDGVRDVDVVQRLGDIFGLHPLTLEDIVNTHQRPKLEDFEDYIYIVLKMPRYDSERRDFIDEQVSFILRPGCVLSFQERHGDVFDPIRERIRGGRGRIRKAGADYLMYALVDAVVDGYFVLLESVGEQVETIEEELAREPSQAVMRRIHNLKRETILVRRAIWPLREVISSLSKNDSNLIEDATMIYLRDVYDHTIQVIDTIESLRDILSGLLDLYLSSVSNRMNEVMKVLTVIATMFIPLTFVAGIYGMNFQNMPELSWRWGYPAVWGIMVVMLVGMLAFFKRKRWF